MSRRELALREVRELAKGAEERIRNFYGLKISYPISVALNSFEVAKFGLLPWAQSGVRATIVVRYPQITAGQIAHEMSHYSLRHIGGTKVIPLWFDEGLACYLGDATLGSSELEAKEALRNSGVPDITGWAGTRGRLAWLFQMYARRRTRAIYGLSLYMVKGLAEMHGLGSLQGLVGLLSTMDFNAAFVRTYGISVSDYYAKDVMPMLSGV
jgi:hypothetical protein